jgi:predicted kinase
VIAGSNVAFPCPKGERVESQKQRIIIELLVGMIGSGKSTYARSHADRGSLVVCHDDLTAMLHAEYRYEPGRREMYRQMEQELVRVAIDHYCFHVIIDRTHLTTESRVRWINFGLEINVPVIARWIGVARHHANQARREPIRPDEGFKEVFEYELSPERKSEDEAENQRIIRLKRDEDQRWMNGVDPNRTRMTEANFEAKAERKKVTRRRLRYAPLQALLDKLAADKGTSP